MDRPETVRRLYDGAMTVSGSITTNERISSEDQVNEVVVGELRELLQHITGTNFAAEHMLRTPERFMKMLQELTTPEPFEFTVFDNASGIDEMIILEQIPFYTLCAHHMVPFFGHAYVAYVPEGCIAGLSKFARAVKNMAKKLTVQEELTSEIADFLEAKLNPKGVAVVLKAEHLCMAMRGVQAPGVLTTTSAMRGVFSDHTRTAKAEFMSVINK